MSKKKKRKLIQRLQEPSTYAGLSLLMTNAGIQLPNGAMESSSYLLAIGACIMAIVLGEK